MLTTPPFEDPAVAARFDALPEADRMALLSVRKLIFDTAAQTPGVGPLLETLKWGQPAYLTQQSKSGTTIRLACPHPGGFALYTHCQTSVISDFRALFPQDFCYEGNRAVHVSNEEPLPLGRLGLLIATALTYHLKAHA